MKPGRRSNAISNSPVVRALIKPIIVEIPTQPAIPLSPPKPSDLLPTQPPPTPSPNTTTESEPGEVESSRKRKRVEDSVNERVEVNYTEENLPKELKKYWAQRYRLFSLYDEGCEMDKEGWYSVTPEYIAAQIAERCRCSVIVDAFCGVGGNAIQFAFTCEKVIAIDNSPLRLACARRNAEIYGVQDRIEFVLGDYPSWAEEYSRKKGKGLTRKEDEVEVVFLSPPWGGIDYIESPTKKVKHTAPSAPSTLTPATSPLSSYYSLSALQPLHGNELFRLSRNITPHVAYYLPRNTDIEQLARLPLLYPRSDRAAEVVEGEEEKVEIEEEWMGTKMKAVTVYFGDLAPV